MISITTFALLTSINLQTCGDVKHFYEDNMCCDKQHSVALATPVPALSGNSYNGTSSGEPITLLVLGKWRKPLSTSAEWDARVRDGIQWLKNNTPPCITSSYSLYDKYFVEKYVISSYKCHADYLKYNVSTWGIFKPAIELAYEDPTNASTYVSDGMPVLRNVILSDNVITATQWYKYTSKGMLGSLAWSSPDYWYDYITDPNASAYDMVSTISGRFYGVEPLLLETYYMSHFSTLMTANYGWS